MKIFFINNKGTTLIELIVGIAIIGIITGAVLANFRVGERTNNLHIATQKLVSDIRQVQNYAMSLKSHIGSIPPGGWGIFFNTNGDKGGSYTFFADTDGDHICQNFNNCPSNNADFIRKIDLPKGVVITQLVADGGNESRVYVSFEAPQPTVHICNAVGACLVDNLEVTLDSFGETKTIIINKFGLIDVK